MSGMNVLFKILLSTFFGGLIGIEREINGCAAGLRTHILVCIGAALFMITSVSVAAMYGDLGDVDASRIAAGVVTGIGFLGAGAIIRYGSSIRGLTTAASIWAVAAIGLAVGAGIYEAAGITTVVALTILILSRLEERMELKRHNKKLVVVIRSDSSTASSEIRDILQAYGGMIKRMDSEDKDGGKAREITLDLMLSRVYRKEVLSEIASLPGVENVCWR